MTDVILKGASYGAQPGDRVSVDPDRAADLVAAGRADYAEKPGGRADTVEAILAGVGDDKTLAQAALEAEQAKGERARSSLVGKLEAILAS
jgi:hypothetical protein